MPLPVSHDRTGAPGAGHFRAGALPAANPGSDRVAEMWIIFIYTPALLCLPALLLVGVVFVVIPGGFIIVLGALYYLLMGFVGEVGLASRTAWRARLSRSASPPPA